MVKEPLMCEYIKSHNSFAQHLASCVYAPSASPSSAPTDMLTASPHPAPSVYVLPLHLIHHFSKPDVAAECVCVVCEGGFSAGGGVLLVT